MAELLQPTEFILPDVNPFLRKRILVSAKQLFLYNALNNLILDSCLNRSSMISYYGHAEA